MGPEDEATASGTFELQWQWSEELEAGHYFAVLVWWEGQQAPSYLGFTKEAVFPLDLASRMPGRFSWTVRIADVRQREQSWILRRFLSPTGDRSSFSWTGPAP